MKTDRFLIEVSPTHRLFSCEEKLAQEARGLFGCHNFDKCPNCRLEFIGFELWGENGHLQGRIPDIKPETLEYAARVRNARIIVREKGFIYRA